MSHRCKCGKILSTWQLKCEVCDPRQAEVLAEFKIQLLKSKLEESGSDEK